MTKLALSGLMAEREAFLDVVSPLSDDEWNMPSGEDGMTVRDIVAHIGASHRLVIEPTFAPGGIDPVVFRRNWDIEAVVREFDRYTEQSAAVFGRMQAINRPRPMGDVGEHPTSLLPDLYLFDMYGHLRADVVPALGRDEPARDETRLRPTVDWMFTALPQMCPVDAAIEITLEGPGGGTWSIGPDAPAVAKVHGTDHDFVLWGTGRRPWRDFVAIDGDEADAARALDAIRII
jgi:uncharacterized protein (TIGR03083 family)